MLNPQRLLASPLGNPLLDVKLGVDLYATNGLRVLGLSGSVDRPTMDAALQKSKTMARLKPTAALGMAVPLGYDRLTDTQRQLDALPKLGEPRYRLLCEVFWPHPASVVETMRSEGFVAAPSVLSLLAAHSKRPALEGALANHALAVALHNQALRLELDGDGNDHDVSQAWQSALQGWKAVIEVDTFWKYLEGRVDALDDPRLARTAVGQVRTKLADTLLGVHQIFAQAYDRAGDEKGCARHIRLLRGPLASAGTTPILKATLQSITEGRFDAVVQEVARIRARGGKVPRSEVTAVVERAHQVVGTVTQFLQNDGGIAMKSERLIDCDRLSGEILRCVNGSIDYQGNDRWAALMFSLITARKMATWPLSPVARREAEQSAQSDVKMLYTGQDLPLPDDVDPAKCWFLPTQWADPDASIVYKMHRVTRVTPMSIGYRSGAVVVPRSKAARFVHDGKPLPNDALGGDLALKLATAEKRFADVGKSAHERIEQESAPIRRDRDAALAPRVAATAAKKATVGVSLAEIEARRVARQREEKTRFDRADQQAREPFVEPMAAARARLTRRQGGPSSVVTAVLVPITAVGGLGMGATTASTELFRQSTGLGQMLAALLGMAVGALIIHRFQRWLSEHSLGPLRMQVARIEEECAQCRTGVEADHKGRKTAIDAELYAEGAPLRATLEQVQHELAALELPFAERLREIEARHSRPVKQAEAELEAVRSEARQRTTVKPSSAASDFPGRRKARSMDFEDGDEPSQSEAERRMKRERDRLINGLTQYERLALAKAQQVLSNEQFKRLIEMLCESPYEGKRLLGTLGSGL